MDKQNLSLSLYWVAGYGGGTFLPFRDLTNNYETYGGGRYLLDTIKHADLGGRTVVWSSTSTTPTTHRALTTPAGSARWRRRRTG